MALASKAFTGSSAKLAAKQSRATAVRMPVVVRAQAGEQAEVVRNWLLRDRAIDWLARCSPPPWCRTPAMGRPRRGPSSRSQLRALADTQQALAGRSWLIKCALLCCCSSCCPLASLRKKQQQCLLQLHMHMLLYVGLCLTYHPPLLPLSCTRAQTRRATMGVLAGVAALAAGAAPSQAAYGDAANVFGKVTNKSGAPVPLLVSCDGTGRQQHAWLLSDHTTDRLGATPLR